MGETFLAPVSGQFIAGSTLSLACSATNSIIGHGAVWDVDLLWVLWSLAASSAGAGVADLKVMVGVDPSDRESMVISVLDMQTDAVESRRANRCMHSKSQDLGDVMRSTRTGEYDVYIAPGARRRVGARARLQR